MREGWIASEPLSTNSPTLGLQRGEEFKSLTSVKFAFSLSDT